MAATAAAAAERTKVYVPDAGAVWLAAEVVESGVVEARRPKNDDPGDGPVERLEVSKGDSASFPLQNDLGEEGAEDMCALDYLHEPGVLFNLRKRYFRKLPYTYTGSMCIAINPYEWLGHMYGEETGREYLWKARERLPPHVYAISAEAYRGVSKFEDARWIGEDQSILVSGESGAGKTETVKIMMAHLASVAGEGDDVVAKVLQSQPLLESFGNAKTVRNDNSSRFGKFTQLEFALEDDDAVTLVGSRCRTYLLEKSRVVSQAPGERTYHCFYGVARKNDLLPLGKLRYTRESDVETTKIENVSDEDRRERTWAALELIGVAEDDRIALERLLGAILQLGELEFLAAADDDEDSSRLASEAPAKVAARELGVASGATLALALTERTIRARSDVYKVPLDASKAGDSRDALAKEIYLRAFDWVVANINASTTSTAVASPRVVGLLDIFGFESFKVNRFEQLCINYTNEKLQQKFTLDLFKTVQQEYDEERIPWTHVSFPDNAPVLQLIDARMGIIDVLNEECMRPRGSDEGFVSKLNSIHASTEPYVAAKLSKDQFTVKHYAGAVVYTATGWLERNNDTLQEDLATCARDSSFGLLALLFAASENEEKKKNTTSKATTKGSSRKRGAIAADTVSTKFKAQLGQLMDEIERTSVQYVRCVKPNTVKSNAAYDAPMVCDQLRCAGVIEAIRVSRAGYPNKLPHGEFSMRFARALIVSADSSIEVAARELLGDVNSYAVGLTKIYFKAGVLETLERRRAAALAASATKVSAAWRCFALFRAYGEARRGATLFAARWRSLAARRAYVKTIAAAMIAQSARRAVLARRQTADLRRHARASRIAAVARGASKRRRYHELRRAATRLAAFARTRAAAREYKIALAEAREQAKLENQLEAMQARLEAMEDANKAMAAQAAAAQEEDHTSAEVMHLLQQLRADNDRLRKEAATLKDENAALKRRVSDLEANQSMRMDWLAAARQTFSHPQETPSRPPPVRPPRPAPSQTAATDDRRSSVSRFANVVASLGFGATPAPKGGGVGTVVSSLPATPENKPDRPTAAKVSGGGDKRRAPHIALPLNRFWQDVPAASLEGALPRRDAEVVLVHLKVGGQYLCATGGPVEPPNGGGGGGGGGGSVVASSPSKQQTPQDEHNRYVRCEAPSPGDDQQPAGYRTAMTFRVERVDDASEEGLARCKFHLKSELTGGYLCVGGLFQRYCLVASAPTRAEATTFQFVARRKDDDDDDADLLATSPDEYDSTTPRDAASMERLRARQLLVALRVVDGAKMGHFVRVRPDAYVNVAPPGSTAVAKGAALPPDDRVTPLLSVELLVPLQSYEITFVSSQLGLIVSKTMPLRVVRFKDSATHAPAAELSGRIGIGDVLITADGRDLITCSRREAVDIITSTRPITIGFRVAHQAQDLLHQTPTRNNNNNNNNSSKPVDLLTP
ncbi:hypothetical protein CTAYLR_000646 [Chrysophaeum taylorii]|uniref:Myosin motor domain-containing protein n=1 Tax=Chrysophaeum taylorii TaxID=2483200 RepID=A0AAD7XI83_9STRA|nr:hypothetical protein CTAYLR_000646 [Chrysophaeum taylorii]